MTKAEMRRLRDELRYFQNMARIEARALKGSVTKCREIGAKMRKLQKEHEKKTTKTPP